MEIVTITIGINFITLISFVFYIGRQYGSINEQIKNLNEKINKIENYLWKQL